MHASREKPQHVSPFFIGRDIRSDKVLIILFSFLLVHIHMDIHEFVSLDSLKLMFDT